MSDNFIEVKHLCKYFPTKKGVLHAVEDLNFEIKKGETLGLVGESGCGKSTAGRAIIRLHEPTSGEIWFNGENIMNRHTKKEMHQLRREMQIVLQEHDLYETCDKVKLISKTQSTIKTEKIIEKINETMERVGM